MELFLVNIVVGVDDVVVAAAAADSDVADYILAVAVVAGDVGVVPLYSRIMRSAFSLVYRKENPRKENIETVEDCILKYLPSWNTV